MDIKSGDPRDHLKSILDDYKLTPHTFGLISGLDEKEVLDFANYETDLAHLPHEKVGHMVSMIGLLSDGMTLVTSDERVKAITEILNQQFQVSFETLALYAKLEEKEINAFMSDCDSLTYEKRYQLAVVVMFLFKLFSDNNQKS
ncbi:HTH domain-containing protein [Halalkalibacter okhensis]|uniref:HTH domain-containing protein n=1 Tax=Halalkalibacter okhensis TaxID=333138 RepID=UPI0027E469CB|nr:HTH domain-containing protein [Halalkalibacter okhensis]